MKLGNLLKENIITYEPFEKKVEDKKGAIPGTELARFFEIGPKDIDYHIVELPEKNELKIKLIYRHKKSGQLIEVDWHIMNDQEIEQEKLYKRFTTQKENGIFRRLTLKHEMPHDNKYDSFKYEVVSEEK